MTRGQLYVFEGADGVGKSTLATSFVNYLATAAIPVRSMSFPGKTPGTLGAHVYKLHHDPAAFDLRTVNLTSLQTLHVAAHIDAIESSILPLLNQGFSVVLDRYWWSTWVYGLVSGVSEDSLRAMIDLELIFWRNVRPTLLFLIDRTMSLREEERNSSWLNKVKEYRTLSRREQAKYPIVVIENETTPDEAHRRVVEAYRQSLLRQQPNRSALDVPAAVTTDRRIPTSPAVLSKISPVKPTEVYDTFWRFAAERQEIFFRRLQACPLPFTSDPILQRHKFTNAYRASDRVSQFLIKNVIYNGSQEPKELFFRTILFKLFNKIETWSLLEDEFGGIRYSDFTIERYDRVLTAAMVKGKRIYSAAYIMPSGGRGSVGKKHLAHLGLLQMMMTDEVPFRLTEVRSMQEGFNLLRSYPMVGDFLGYQFITDLNYSELTDFSEMEFVVPGLGARDGLRKCFSSLGGLSEADVIRLVAERQEQEFDRLGLSFRSLWGRPLQLIDCQNLFCEVDKYARVAHPNINGLTGRTRIKQTFHYNLSPIHFWYPPKWGLNTLINQQG